MPVMPLLASVQIGPALIALTRTCFSGPAQLRVLDGMACCFFWGKLGDAIAAHVVARVSGALRCSQRQGTAAVAEVSGQAGVRVAGSHLPGGCAH